MGTEEPETTELKDESSSTPEAATADDSPTSGHVLVVEIYEDDPEEVRGTVICLGVTDRCVTWWECIKEHDFDRSLYDDLIDAVYEGEDLFHGEEHQVIDSRVMTRGTECLARSLDSGWESAQEAARGLKPGRYPCDVLYEGDEYVNITVLPGGVS